MRDPAAAPVISQRPILARAIVLLDSAKLPVADLTERHCEHFFYAGDARCPVGLVGLEPLGSDALLRSLVVTAAERGSGTGSALVECAEQYARTRGVASLYLLTTTAEDFFARRGYSRVPRDSAPASIKATPEVAGICPVSSAFMRKQL